MSEIETFLIQFLETQKSEVLDKRVNSDTSVRNAKLAYDEQRYKLKFAKGEQDKLDQALKNFVEKKQVARIKHEPETNERYDLPSWFTQCLRNTQSFRSTHVTKFSHSAISGINAPLFYGKAVNDGYLKTGNVLLKQQIDVSGDAVLNQYILEFYRLLSMSINGKKVIDLFVEKNPQLQAFIISKGLSFELLRDKAIHHFFDHSESVKSDGILKQVYFPVSNEYHLLSTTTASCIVSELRQRINAHKFGATDDDKDCIKFARQCKGENKFCETDLVDYASLTEIGFGGSHPKNISILCNSNRGLYYLLPCIPPKLVKRDVQLPTQDFFKSCLRLWQFKDDFFELHRLMGLYANNMHNRDAITDVLKAIIDQILARAFEIRVSTEAGWSEREHYQELPLRQRIWLDVFHSKDHIATDEWATGVGKREGNHEFLREDDDMWLDAITTDCARWIILSYQSILEKDAISLSDDELTHLKMMVEDAITAEKEFFV
jgi:CRISPR-associated protein Csy1